ACEDINAAFNNAAFNLVVVAHIDWADLNLEQWGHGLDGDKLAGPGTLGGFPKDRHPRHAWRDLLEQFQPLHSHGEFHGHEAGDVASRPRQALDQAVVDRIV